VQSAPALDEANGMIYVGSEDHKVYAFNLADRLADPAGATFPTANEWFYATGDKVKTQPAIGSDGRIYVGSEDHRLWGDPKITGCGPLTRPTAYWIRRGQLL
jgi:outer membrane protein assembly factor BamB